MTADTEALWECYHPSLTRYVGCGGRSYWICDGCERAVRRGEKEPPAAPAAPWEALGRAVDAVLAKSPMDMEHSCKFCGDVLGDHRRSCVYIKLSNARAATVPK